MAYNADNEKRVEHGLVPKNDRGEYVKVTRIIPKSSSRLESIDIRLMWTNEAGSILPSQKGVRIHSEMLVDVVKSVVMAMSQEERDELVESLASDGITFGAAANYEGDLEIPENDSDDSDLDD